MIRKYPKKRKRLKCKRNWRETLTAWKRFPLFGEFLFPRWNYYKLLISALPPKPSTIFCSIQIHLYQQPRNSNVNFKLVQASKRNRRQEGSVDNHSLSACSSIIRARSQIRRLSSHRRAMAAFHLRETSKSRGRNFWQAARSPCQFIPNTLPGETDVNSLHGFALERTTTDPVMWKGAHDNRCFCRSCVGHRTRHVCASSQSLATTVHELEQWAISHSRIARKTDAPNSVNCLRLICSGTRWFSCCCTLW